MSHIFGRQTAASLPIAARGEGPYIIDVDGKRYIDASGGAAVSCLGHSHPKVRAAIHHQLDRLAFAHTGFFTSAPAEALADQLVASAPEGIDRVYLLSGGSEAIEASLKLARQYYLEIGQPQRSHVISRRQSYHGNTLGALASGGNLLRRTQFEPLLIETTQVSACNTYRGVEPGETPESYGQRLADELDATIRAIGPDKVMCFLAETVGGATAGVLTPVPGYLRRVREVCDRHGILLILDEVMCGMGRTGSFFACEQDGVSPDIVAIAKGLGAGYQPIGALMCKGRIYQAIADGSGAFQHGHTYMGHTLAAAGSVAVAAEIRELLDTGQIAHLSQRLFAGLNERLGQHAHVGDIRGRGLFAGIELVRDRDSKDPFDPDQKIAAKIKAAAMEAGLICYPGTGTADGRRGDHILLAPPFILDDAQMDEVLDKLERTISVALNA